MKVLRTKEVTLCDYCQEEFSYADVCLRCGKECCWKCAKTNFITYPHAMHVSGSGDGHYCIPCDKELSKRYHEFIVADPLHSAYLTLARLRIEAEGYQRDFNARVKAAEDRIKSLLGRS